MSRSINIVSFSVPFPANYGGAIDVFYKIKSLHAAGVNIHLHCFQYDRKAAAELNEYCVSVKYYERKMNPSLLFSKYPFIVAGRHSEQLVKALKSNDYPILLEGLHSCFLLTTLEKNGLANRKFLVRSHNIEHDYYEKLAEAERNPLKRFYFRQEAKKLKRFENEYLTKAAVVFGISDKDCSYLQNKYGNAKKLSAFHEFEKFQIDQEAKPYACYHGNLSVGENDQAAQFLVDEVFSELDYELIIAGSKPSEELRQKCKQKPNVELRENISSSEIMSLIAKAQINVLPTFQSTGIKLKLLAALYRGKHLLVNPQMVKGTGLDELCVIANGGSDFKSKIQELAAKSFDNSVIQNRESTMKEFSNEFNVQQLLNYIDEL